MFAGEDLSLPPREPTNLERRQAAAQATLDHFRSKPFSFEDGNDCAKMAAFCAKQMGIKIPLAKVGRYKTALSARAALKKQFGVENVSQLADKFFERINPAQALMADFIEMRSDHPLGSLTVYLGNELVIAYHPDAEGAVAGRLHEPPIAAWRTLPL